MSKESEEWRTKEISASAQPLVEWHCPSEEVEAAMTETWWNLGQLILWIAFRDPIVVARSSDNSLSGPGGPNTGNIVAAVILENRFPGHTADQRAKHLEEARRALKTGSIKTTGLLQAEHIPREIPDTEWSSLDIEYGIAGIPGLVRIKDRGEIPSRTYDAVKVKRADVLVAYPANRARSGTTSGSDWGEGPAERNALRGMRDKAASCQRGGLSANRYRVCEISK